MKAPDHVNAVVVEMIKACYEEALQGKMNFFAYVACEAGGNGQDRVWGDRAGSYFMEKVAKHGLETLARKLDSDVENRTPPPPDPSLGVDYFCYNVPAATPSYDIITTLVAAEMRRRREGAPAPLKVGFWMGRTGQAGMEIDYRRQMLEHVVKPALQLIGAVEDERACRGYTTDNYVVGPIVEAARRGEKVPILQVWNHLIPVGLCGAVTITLRESDLWPHRNSNLKHWLRFADWLKRQGEKVVFVRDTAKVMQAMPDGWKDYPAASIDLHARMALYQNARANLFVSNGPALLGLFSDRPWLQFIQLQPDGHAYQADTPAFWAKHMLIGEGDQFPWSQPNQRMIWKPDTFDNMVEAWQTYIAGDKHAQRIPGAGRIHGHVTNSSGTPETAGARQDASSG